MLQVRRINQFLGSHYTPDEVESWSAEQFALVDMAIEEYGRKEKSRGR